MTAPDISRLDGVAEPDCKASTAALITRGITNCRKSTATRARNPAETRKA